MVFQKQYLLQNAKHLNLHECGKTLMKKYTSKTGSSLEPCLGERKQEPTQKPSWVFQISNFTFKGFIVTRLPKNQLLVSLPEEVTESDIFVFYDFISYVKERNKRVKVVDLDENQVANINKEIIRSCCQKQRAWFTDLISSGIRVLDRPDDEILAYKYPIADLKKVRPDSTMDELVDEMQTDLIKNAALNPWIPENNRPADEVHAFVMKWDSSVSSYLVEDFILASDYRQFGMMGSWGVADHEKVCIGDNIFLLRTDGPYPGIVWWGTIVRSPVEDTDVANPERKKWYVKFRIDALVYNPDENMLSLHRMKELMPEIDWDTCPNGILLTKEQQDLIMQEIDLFQFCIFPSESIATHSVLHGKDIHKLLFRNKKINKDHHCR